MRNRGSLLYFVALASMFMLPNAAPAQEQTAGAAGPVSAPAPAPASGDSVTPAPPSTPATELADNTPHAAVDPFFKPVPPGKLKGVKVKKEKPPKTVHLVIEHGVLTVDGWTGKADLNYDIDDFQYFYIWAPGVGTVIVSEHPFAGAKVQYNAFSMNTLTVKVDEHQLQLTADHRILPGKPKELDAPAYVAFDPDFAPTSSKYPVFGYGVTTKAPYTWPGSLLDQHANADAPPLPQGVRPTIQTKTVCPQGIASTTGSSACTSVPVPMAPGKKKKQEREASL